MLAAVLLVARKRLVSMGLPCPSVDAVLATTGGTRSRAFTLSAALIALLPTLVKPRGRRPAPPLAPSAKQDDSIALTRKVLGYVMHHPGCVGRGHERQRHSDGFRPFVLELHEIFAAIQAFAELGLLDPERHIRLAIAGYPRDAILSGIAICLTKKRAGTLPDGVDARYLLGIVKNVSAKTEREILAEELFDQRTAVRDLILAPLIAERDALRAGDHIALTIATCVDRALAIPSSLAAAIAAEPEHTRRLLFPRAGRRIDATIASAPSERHDAIR